MDKATKDYLKVKATEVRVRSGSQKDPEIINIEDELPEKTDKTLVQEENEQ